MKNIVNNLYVGNDYDCKVNKKSDFSIIHSCKLPCYYSQKKMLLKTSKYYSGIETKYPDYLVYEKEKNLYLSIIDGSDKYFTLFIFISAFKCINKQIVDNKILVHYNKDLSRSPMIIMMFLAFQQEQISSNNYDCAKRDFQEHFYPKYLPSP